MDIASILAGAGQLPGAPTPASPQAVNPALIPTAGKVLPNPMAVAPPRAGGMPMPRNPFMGGQARAAIAPVSLSDSLQGLMQGAPGGSRPAGFDISALANNNTNSGSSEQASSDNADEQQGNL